MNVLQSLFRALRDALSGEVVRSSFLPAFCSAAILVLIGYFSWDIVQTVLNNAVENPDFPDWVGTVGRWTAPILLMWLTMPIMVFVALLIANFFVFPVVSKRVWNQTYPDIQRLGDDSLSKGLLWLITSMLVALLAWILTLPLSAFPPLAWLAQLLIWGWLNYRLMSWDVLASYASEEERNLLLDRHRGEFWLMGLACGFATSFSMFLWLFSLFTLLLSPVVVMISIWLQLMLFVFAALWFSHFSLSALQRLRQEPIDVTVRRID